MESRIPVPTDNIYKFYALFGLLLFVFSCGALLYVNTTSNAVVFASVPELEALKEFEHPSRSDLAQIALLERKLEITKTDKKVFDQAIGVISALGFIVMVYGFIKWHTDIQPILDETAKTQLAIAKLELIRLQRELGEPEEASPVPAKPPAIAAAQTSPD